MPGHVGGKEEYAEMREGLKGYFGRSAKGRYRFTPRGYERKLSRSVVFQLKGASKAIQTGHWSPTNNVKRVIYPHAG